MYPQIRIDLYRYVYIPTVGFAARATPARATHTASMGDLGSATREHTNRGGIVYKFIRIYVCVYVLICTYIIVYVCGAAAARTAYAAPVGDFGSATCQYTFWGGKLYMCTHKYV